MPQYLLLTAIFLFSAVCLGGYLGRKLKKENPIFKFLLIFSAGFLLTITVSEIFPTIFSGHDNKHHIGYWVLGGVLLQILLESLTKGFEHGHHHHQKESGIITIGLASGLFIHAFLEGIPLSQIMEGKNQLIWGIAIHNIPVSLLMGSFFLNSNASVPKKIIFLVFAAATPLGILLGGYFPSEYSRYALAIVAGIFLHISSVIIFESDTHHKFDNKKMAYVVLGIASAAIIQGFHTHIGE